MVLTGNILAVSHGVIVHQVNCQGVMGCGIALQIRQRWPVVYKRYRAHKFQSGQIQLVQVAPDLWVCNLAGQDGFGQDKRYTDYKALKVAFAKLNLWASERKLSIAIPYHMGYSNAGGDWDVVFSIIASQLTDCEVTIYRKGG